MRRAAPSEVARFLFLGLGETDAQGLAGHHGSRSVEPSDCGAELPFACTLKQMAFAGSASSER